MSEEKPEVLFEITKEQLETGLRGFPMDVVHDFSEHARHGSHI